MWAWQLKGESVTRVWIGKPMIFFSFCTKICKEWESPAFHMFVKVTWPTHVTCPKTINRSVFLPKEGWSRLNSYTHQQLCLASFLLQRVQNMPLFYEFWELYSCQITFSIKCCQILTKPYYFHTYLVTWALYKNDGLHQTQWHKCKCHLKCTRVPFFGEIIIRDRIQQTSGNCMH